MFNCISNNRPTSSSSLSVWEHQFLFKLTLKKKNIETFTRSTTRTKIARIERDIPLTGNESSRKFQTRFE